MLPGCAWRRETPRLVGLSWGNCSNEQVAQALLTQHGVIERTFADPAVALIELIAPR